VSVILLTIAGIVLPALAIVFALRRWLVAPDNGLVAILFALVFVFLGGALFTSDVPLPLDEVIRGYPYAGLVGPVQVRNPLTNDTVKLFLPWMSVMRSELFAGRVPLWNPYSFSGYPLLANGESAPWSPFFLATLFVPLPKQMVAMAGLKLFVALLFGYLFIESRISNRWASLFGSVVFAFSVHQTVYLYYTAAAVSSLLPAICFATFHAFDKDTRAARVFLALVTASVIAAGHPESAFHCAVAVAGLLAIEGILATDRTDWARRTAGVTFCALLGALIAAPSWIPVLEQVFRSTRFVELRHAGLHVATMRMPVNILWMLLSPNGYGNPVRHNWSWILNYSVAASGYFGLLALVFFAASLLGRRVAARDRLTAVFALLTFLVAMRWTPLGDIINRIPPFTFVANDKLRFVTTFLIAMSASSALARQQGNRSAIPPLTCAALLTGLLWLFVRKLHITLQPSDAIGIVVLAITFLALLPSLFQFSIFNFQFRPPRLLPLIVAALAALELLTLNAPFNALVDGKYYRPQLPIVEALKKVAPREPFRIVGHDWTFLPNASALYGLEDIRGSDPMSWAPYTTFLNPLTAQDKQGADVQRVIRIDDPAIDHLNVAFLMTDPGLAVPMDHWRSVYSGPDGNLYENRRFISRFFPEDGNDQPLAIGSGSLEVRRLSSRSFRINVHALQPLRIGSSEPALPGWVVRRGDERLPIRRGRDPFVGFDVPAGESQVTVRYEPPSFLLSCLASVIGALCLIARCHRRN